MSVDYSLALFTRRVDLVNGLQQLLSYETLIVGSGDHHWYIPNKPVAAVADLVTEYSKRIDTPEDEELGETNLAKCAFREGDQVVTLSFTPWTQRIYEFTRSGHYWMSILEFSMGKNQDFVPADHACLPLLIKIVRAIKPTFVGLEGELNPTPSTYSWATAKPSPIIEPPWSLMEPVVLGNPLSERTRQLFDFCRPESGIFNCQHLDPGLFWIFQPGTQAEWEQYRWEMWDRLYKGTEVGERHQAAMLRLREALAKIPASVLNDVDGSGV